ncbi:transposase [Calothrix sp. NIES-4101]|nr:transposase [Calothrix sp. NIES-4101]
MSQYSELKRVLQAQLPWHGARISFLALFLLALLKVKTVNLSDLCLGFGGRALSRLLTLLKIRRFLVLLFVAFNPSLKPKQNKGFSHCDYPRFLHERNPKKDTESTA